MEKKEEPKWIISKLCARCSNPKCTGYGLEEAKEKGCLTLFWLSVGELTLEEAIRARQNIEEHYYSRR